MLGEVFIMETIKKISKAEAYKKIEFYSREITKKKPTWDTVFRIYYDSLKIISEILYNIQENPWHPENYYSGDIFLNMNEKFEELEQLRLKAIG